MQNLTKEIKLLLETKETQDFLKVAREFIELVETKEIKEQEFYPKIHKKLTELYNVGLSLKSVELIHSSEKSKFDCVSEEELREENSNLIAHLGTECFYWKVFDSTYEKENEPIQGWLVDDVADIYADLKEEVYKIDKIGTDESIEDGLWQLKFGFTTHWGNHCVSAIRALHYTYYDGKITM